jgi:hypothetical protein
MFATLDLQKILGTIQVVATYDFVVKSKKNREKIQDKIMSLIKKHNLPYIRKEYVRAIGNGIKHGQCPVKCHVYIGKNMQTIITIQDSGHGFDYKDVVSKFVQGKKYYHHHGCGTRSYAHNERLAVDWANQGRTIILYYQ